MSPDFHFCRRSREIDVFERLYFDFSQISKRFSIGSAFRKEENSDFVNIFLVRLGLRLIIFYRAILEFRTPKPCQRTSSPQIVFPPYWKLNRNSTKKYGEYDLSVHIARTQPVLPTLRTQKSSYLNTKNRWSLLEKSGTLQFGLEIEGIFRKFGNFTEKNGEIILKMAKFLKKYVFDC